MLECEVDDVLLQGGLRNGDADGAPLIRLLTCFNIYKQGHATYEACGAVHGGAARLYPERILDIKCYGRIPLFIKVRPDSGLSPLRVGCPYFKFGMLPDSSRASAREEGLNSPQVAIEDLLVHHKERLRIERTSLRIASVVLRL